MRKLAFALNLVLILSHCCCATVPEGESIRQYFTCNGSTTTFTFTQPCNSADDVLVYTHLIATGVETALVEDTDYTIAATGGDYLNGGVVTISPALASTYKVVIVRSIKQSQETSSGAMTPISVVAALDKVTRQVQDLQDGKDRSIHLQESDASSFDMELAELLTRASSYLGFDDTGALTYLSSAITDGAIVSSFMATVNDDPSAGAAKTTLGITDVDGYTDFATAVSAIGSTVTTLRITTSQAVSTNVSVPQTLTLLFSDAGDLAIDTGVTVTINGLVKAELQQIFDLTGTGVVSFAEGSTPMVYPQWWGVVADGTDEKAVINKALAALPAGGHIHFPVGTYYMPLTDSGSFQYNILESNITISGDGPGTIIKGNYAGGQNTGVRNAAFQAEDEVGITIRDLLSQTGSLISFDGGSNHRVENITSNGSATYCIYVGAVDTKISNCVFEDYTVPVYVGIPAFGSATNTVIQGCTFSCDTPLSTYPASIYLNTCTDTLINNCIFKDIFSTQAAGGRSYGVYAGDGDCDSFTVSNCTFKSADATYTEAIAIGIAGGQGQININNNVMEWDDNIGNNRSLITYVGTGNTGDLALNITGNICSGLMAYPFVLNHGDGNGHNLRLNVSSNYIDGGGYTGVNSACIYFLSSGDTSKATFTGNIFRNSSRGLWVYGDDNAGTTIVGNTIETMAYSGIQLSYCGRYTVVGNTIHNGCTVDHIQSSIYLHGTMHGVGTIIGNVITSDSSGAHDRYGISAATAFNAADYVVRIQGNIIHGTKHANPYPATGGWNASPTTAYGWQEGYVVPDRSPASGSAGGWMCSKSIETDVKTELAAAGTKLYVDDNSGMAASDIVGVQLDNTKWHWTSINGAPGNDGGGDYITLTDAIPTSRAAEVDATVFVTLWVALANLV